MTTGRSTTQFRSNSSPPHSWDSAASPSAANPKSEVFARFGVAVIEGADCMISGEHPIVSAVIESGFAAECITVHNGAHVSSIEQWGSQTAEILGDDAEVTGDKLLAPGIHGKVAVQTRICMIYEFRTFYAGIGVAIGAYRRSTGTVFDPNRDRLLTD